MQGAGTLPARPATEGKRPKTCRFAALQARPPLSLEKKKERKRGKGRVKKKEVLPCLHILHKRHKKTHAPHRPYPHCASPAPSGPSYVHHSHLVGFTALSKADSTHTDDPAPHHRHRYAAIGTCAARTWLGPHLAPRQRQAHYLMATARQSYHPPTTRQTP